MARFRSRGELASDLLDVVVQLGVANDGHLPLDLRRGLASELNVLFFGKEIPTRFQLLRSGRKSDNREE